MENDRLMDEWLSLAKMDFDTAEFLYENMVPQPFEIICYHCQQASEKYLKALFVHFKIPLLKTHDLGLLAETLDPYLEMEDEVLDACDNLTPFGVKFRYPHELFIEAYHVERALKDMLIVRDWAMAVFA